VGCMPDSTNILGGGPDARQAGPASTPLLPLLYAFQAVLVLAGFGGVWLSVRGHPYTDRISGWALALVVAVAVVNISATAWVTGRTGTGASDPGQRKWRAWKVIMVLAWLVGYTTTAPDYHAGASHPVWGLYPVSGPLLIIAGATAAVTAALRYWPLATASLAIAVAAAAAGFGGPVGAWLITGIGLCAVHLGSAVYTAWRQERPDRPAGAQVQAVARETS
jgi:hypothetical protein